MFDASVASLYNSLSRTHARQMTTKLILYKEQISLFILFARSIIELLQRKKKHHQNQIIATYYLDPWSNFFQVPSTSYLLAKQPLQQSATVAAGTLLLTMPVPSPVALAAVAVGAPPTRRTREEDVLYSDAPTRTACLRARARSSRRASRRVAFAFFFPPACWLPNLLACMCHGHQTSFSTAMPWSSGRASPRPRRAATGPQQQEEEEDTRWRTSRKWSSSQGSAMGPGAAGKPYSSSACRSSSRNAGWLRCATRTTNRLGPEDGAVPCTDTATCPAGTDAKEEEEDEAASAARDRHRRSVRRSLTSDGIVITTLHILETWSSSGRCLASLLRGGSGFCFAAFSCSRGCGIGRDGVAIYIGGGGGGRDGNGVVASVFLA